MPDQLSITQTQEMLSIVLEYEIKAEQETGQGKQLYIAIAASQGIGFSIRYPDLKHFSVDLGIGPTRRIKLLPWPVAAIAWISDIGGQHSLW